MATQTMINEDGSPNTAHTMNPGSFFVIDNEFKGPVKPGKPATWHLRS